MRMHNEPYQNLKWEEKLHRQHERFQMLNDLYYKYHIEATDAFRYELGKYLELLKEYRETYSDGVSWCRRCGRTGKHDGFYADWASPKKCPICESDDIDMVDEFPDRYQRIYEASMRYLDVAVIGITDGKILQEMKKEPENEDG